MKRQSQPPTTALKISSFPKSERYTRTSSRRTAFRIKRRSISTTLLIPKDSPFAGTLLEAVQAIQKTNGLKDGVAEG